MYDGSVVSENLYTVSGDTEATEPGEYTLIFTSEEDLDAEEKQLTWYIEIDWSNADISVDNPVIELDSGEAPVITVTVDGAVIDPSYYTVTGDDETEAGLHTVTVTVDDTSVGTVDYYIYEIGLIREDVAGSDVKVKYYATRNKDTENITTFGLLLDNKKTHTSSEFDNGFDASRYTYNKTATKTSVTKYSITISDTGLGIYVRPYMIINVNGSAYAVYGDLDEIQKLNPPEEEKIAIKTTQTVADGKVAFEINRGEPIEGYEFVAMGVLFSRTGKITSVEDAKTKLVYENIDNDGVGKGQSTKATVKTYTVRVKFTTYDTMYTRGYVILKNTATNENEYVYADVVESVNG
jgi:hypothetical protein